MMKTRVQESDVSYLLPSFWLFAGVFQVDLLVDTADVPALAVAAVVAAAGRHRTTAGQATSDHHRTACQTSVYELCGQRSVKILYVTRST